MGLSCKPPYVLAQGLLHGEAGVKGCGCGFGLVLDAWRALEAPVGDDDLFFGGKVQIKILGVWQQQGGQWKLLARQAVRVAA